MLALVRNAEVVEADPSRWMPWNFPAALANQTALVS